jgi:hypothetical protein
MATSDSSLSVEVATWYVNVLHFKIVLSAASDHLYVLREIFAVLWCVVYCAVVYDLLCCGVI